MPMPAGKFAFQTAQTSYTGLGETLGSLEEIPALDGKGKSIDAANALIDSHNSWRNTMQSKAADVASACGEQHGVDVPLASAPSVADVADKQQKFSEAKGEAKLSALSAYREAKDAHEAAVETHRTGTNPTPGRLGGVSIPSLDGTGTPGGDGRNSGHPGYGTGIGSDGTPGGMGSGSGLGGDGMGGDDLGAGGGDLGSTHLSSDLDGDMDPTKAGRSALNGQPQFPPMQPGQGQGQQGAQPGAGGTGAMPGGGIPGAGGMGATMGPNGKKRDKKYGDPLDDLRTDLSGAGAGAAGGAAAAVGVDRGQTLSGVHTNARINGAGTTAPTNLSGAGAPPGANAGNQGGMGGRGMMGGMPMGAGAGGMGSKGAKKPDDVPAAHQSREQVGYNSITDAVEGGLLSRSTAAAPEFPFRENNENLRPGNPQRWDSDLGKWVTVDPEHDDRWK